MSRQVFLQYLQYFLISWEILREDYAHNGADSTTVVFSINLGLS